MEETLENRVSVAAPLIFILTVFLHLMPVLVEQFKKRGSWNAEEKQLRQEIKDLLKEASTLSNPSTFAQAALLRRTAAAKEKELKQSQEVHKKKNQLPYDMCLKAFFILKVTSYPLLILWFWSEPVAAMSPQLLQPFGKMLSRSTRGPINSQIVVGVIPWLVISSRVSKFISQKIAK